MGANLYTVYMIMIISRAVSENVHYSLFSVHHFAVLRDTKGEGQMNGGVFSLTMIFA